MAQQNSVGWFEIPVTDMERATKFYETVLGVKLNPQEPTQIQMNWFPWEDDGYGAAGTLVLGEGYVPSQEGTLVYFSSRADDISVELGRVEAAGGKVLQEKFPIGEHGFVGLVLDTEGNRIAFHSRK